MILAGVPGKWCSWIRRILISSGAGGALMGSIRSTRNDNTSLF